MGILRVDKLSGLETPTPVTGSVLFDGNDHLDIDISNGEFAYGTGDFTWELWFNADAGFLAGSGGYLIDHAPASTDGNDGSIWAGSDELFYHSAGVSGPSNLSFGGIEGGVWYHAAVSRKSGTTKLFLNGLEVNSATDNADFTTSLTRLRIADYIGSGYNYIGYISNLRIVKGTALYTSNFTPKHELEVIGDTVLLCCNNPDSVTAASYAGIGTSRIITTSGDPSVGTASTEFPGLTRDFTYGTEFKGVTTFDTQGYFVPPSGTTEQRGNDRGVFGGGENPSVNNVIQFVNTSSSGTSQDFGDLVRTQVDMGATGSQTRGLFAGGDVTTAPLIEENTIQFITIASTGNALDFGDLTGRRKMVMGGGTNTRGVFGGGTSSPGNHESNIDYVTVASLGNAQDFGDLDKTPGERGASQVTGSPTRGIFYVKDNSINYITWATTGNALDFGDTDVDSGGAGAVGDKTRSCMHGSTAGYNNSIEYITISTLGNGQDFGDLTEAMRYQYGASNPTRGVMAGDSNDFKNTINFITIQTTGNAKNFGDLSTGQQRGIGLSGCHGGIS